MISSGGLTDRLRRLEGGGLIARETSPSDGRSIMVRLTPRGKSLIDRAFCEDMATEDAMLGALNRAERKQLAQLLAKLLADLERETRA
jgi:DNA-binding MarR family transcriptional regulator